LRVEAILNTFNERYKEEDECYQLIPKSEYTAKKANADHQRDNLIIGMRNIVKKTAVYHFDANVMEAAKRLEILFERYKKLETWSYDAETAGITNLLQELQGNYSRDVSLLNIKEWVIQLEIENKAFEGLVKAALEEKSDKSLFRIKTIRKQIDSVCFSLIEHINALLIMEGEDAYIPFIQKFNTIASHYNTLVAQHKGRNAAKKGKE
jgi:hypothetical protein